MNPYRQDTIINVFRLILAALFLYVASRQIFTMIRELLDRFREWRSPVVPGTIITSSIGVAHTRDGEPFDIPSIEYQYLLNGTAYISNKITFGVYTVPSALRNKSPEEVINLYPVGQSVQVHYDPRHPENSALELERRLPNLGYEIITTSLLIGFAVLFILG